MDSLERAMRANDSADRIERNVSNDRYGVGGANDMVEQTTLNDRFFSKEQLETLYRNFWSVAKVIDLKVDDVFGPGIIWSGEEESKVDRIKEEFDRLEIMKKIPEAIKSGRLYGTSLAILAPSNGDFGQELIVDEIQEGDISHILVADRFALEDVYFYGDPRNPKFGQPHIYKWNFRQVSSEWVGEAPKNYLPYLEVHSSRTIRFDGISALGDDGWMTGSDDRWGISVLARVVDDVVQDTVQNAALQDLVKRAAIPVFKIARYREFLAKGILPKGEAPPETYASQFAKDLQEALAVFIDRNDEVDKIDVHTTGVQDIIKAQTDRIATIEGVPISRFTGESATGLSATGNGDARDWRITIDAYRKRSIDPQWKKIMEIVSKNAGLEEPPEWEWGKLGEATFEETVESSRALAETVSSLLQANTIDESEAREVLNNSELFDLKEDWEPPPIEVPMPGGAGGAKPPAGSGTKPTTPPKAGVKK